MLGEFAAGINGGHVLERVSEKSFLKSHPMQAQESPYIATHSGDLHLNIRSHFAFFPNHKV